MISTVGQNEMQSEDPCCYDGEDDDSFDSDIAGVPRDWAGPSNRAEADFIFARRDSLKLIHYLLECYKHDTNSTTPYRLSMLDEFSIARFTATLP